MLAFTVSKIFVFAALFYDVFMSLDKVAMRKSDLWD